MKLHRKYLARQDGGTLMGLILGLVIGLGIAVAVALLITKTSMPFTNKNIKTDKADVPATQMQDPNKPLYGSKDAVKEAAKEVAKAIDSSKPSETATKVAEVKAETKLTSNSAEKISEKPQERPEAKTSDSASKTDAADDKYVYFLQAGAFRELTDAESARAKLALLGFEAKISEKASDNGTLYRVRIGPFGQLEIMNRMRSKLSENSVDVAVVRTAK
ncbi:SPOR domain-containing protein [Undibacterium sp. Ren11W]|uniref:SPOR domain-containing protein n=1 Tax=Undibacterium sp. Ren11W TaxID=3413045 RepID=UPI003BEFC673